MRCLAGPTVAGWLLFCPWTSHAQAVEVTPFVGHRFGGDVFERVIGQPVDLDGTRAVGALVNVKVRTPGLFAEALVTHQEARVTVPGGLFAPPVRWRITVDHWQGGGLQELGTGQRARPFLTGLVGLTRYVAAGDAELRVTVGGGAGVKLMPIRHVGVRFDGRVFATFADLDAPLVACSTGAGVCLIGLDADILWQLEFSAGIVVAFP